MEVSKRKPYRSPCGVHSLVCYLCLTVENYFFDHITTTNTKGKITYFGFPTFTAIVGLEWGITLWWTATYTSRNWTEYIFIQMTAQDGLSKAYDWNARYLIHHKRNTFTCDIVKLDD